ncbi:hypothetical protein [Promicromonospora sukumoe]|uniref:hypothetical protein n=1 Tax=Promicromonospora sukumoe TaxID=88382 RepID=UPI0012FC1CA9|nr:hypothetical protein [Promicromonospora sukumoe]
MTTMPRPGTRATVVWSALVALLFVLAGPLGVATAAESGAATPAGPAPSAATAQQHVASSAVERVVPVTDDCPAHGAQHETQALGVLCLSASMAGGVATVVPDAWTYRVEPAALAAGGNQWLRTRALAHTAGHDPVLRGISRT